MTETEERVAAHIRTYAGGLSVSDTDIRKAHAELHDRLSHRAHRRRVTVALAVAASTIALVAAIALRPDTGPTDNTAPAATTPAHRALDGLPPTVARLTGIWRMEDAGSTNLMVFGAEGTFAIDDLGRLDDPWSHGTYQVSGRTIELKNLGGYGCPYVSTFAALAGMPEDGRLDVVLTEAAAGGDCHQDVGGKFSYTRVSPGSSAGAKIVGDEKGAKELVSTNVIELVGIWLQQGTGRLMRLAPNDTYAVDDNGALAGDPDDKGTLTFGGPGQVTLTSSKDSRECASGDSSTWGQVRASGTTLVIREAQNTCQGRAALSGTWVRLS